MTNEGTAEIARALDSANKGRWSSQHLELQDNRKFLLVSVAVPDDMPQQEIEAIRADIRVILRRTVPPRTDDYAWTAVIKKRGAVVDSLMGGCSGLLPEI